MVFGGKAGLNDHLLPILIDHINVFNINGVKGVRCYRRLPVKASGYSSVCSSPGILVRLFHSGGPCSCSK